MDLPYSRDVLRRATQIDHVGRLRAPDAVIDRTAKLCGSHVHIEVNVQDPIISDFAIEIKACALGQASAAILSQGVIGASFDEIQTARDALAAMLKGGVSLFPERFDQLTLLQSVRDFPARHGAVLLAWDAVLEAIRHQGLT